MFEGGIKSNMNDGNLCGLCKVKFEASVGWIVDDLQWVILKI